MDLTVGTRLGPYEIIAALGAGGMGEVYRARDTRLDRDVAIKFLLRDRVADPAMKHRFLQEARAASALNHPNIVVLHDISSHEGLEFLVMEHVAGKTLNDLIAPDGMPLDRVTKLGAQVASALAAAHVAGIIHRDIKPANIMVTADEIVKVLDFGIAKIVARAAGPDGPTQTIAAVTTPGMVVGTVSSMSPEQTRGEAIDARSDIFSLGCVLHQAATGQVPFRGASAIAIMHEIATVIPAAPSSLRPGLPGEFDALIARCLAKNPDQRFATMEDVASALRRVAGRSGRAMVDVRTSISAIAVLPFVNVSGDPENEYFGDGLAEELITGLSRIEALHVTARSSAFAFRDKALDVRAIGKALNVGAVLEGSVRRSGNRLRIAVQLVNVADGYHLWSERYDREITDVFDTQDEMSRIIVDKLRPRLQGEVAVPLLKRHTEDPEAYGLYLKGRYYWERRPVGTTRAIECFEKAIDRDPQYALAHSGLADAYTRWRVGRAASFRPRWVFARDSSMRSRPSGWIPIWRRAMRRSRTHCYTTDGTFLQRNVASRMPSDSIRTMGLRTTGIRTCWSRTDVWKNPYPKAWLT